MDEDISIINFPRRHQHSHYTVPVTSHNSSCDVNISWGLVRVYRPHYASMEKTYRNSLKESGRILEVDVLTLFSHMECLNNCPWRETLKLYLRSVRKGTLQRYNPGQTDRWPGGVDHRWTRTELTIYLPIWNCFRTCFTLIVSVVENKSNKFPYPPLTLQSGVVGPGRLDRRKGSLLV